MKLLGLFGAAASIALAAAPAYAAVPINGSIAVSIPDVSANTATINVGTTFSFGNSSVGNMTGNFFGTKGLTLQLSDLTAAATEAFRFTSAFGNYTGTVQSVSIFGDANNRVVSAYVLGIFTPLGTLSNYAVGPASVTFSFTQTGASAVTSGSFTLASPPAAITAVPEITTWSMMILGFGLMGASLRYRRRSATVVFG